jgi:hypothetical protein
MNACALFRTPTQKYVQQASKYHCCCKYALKIISGAYVKSRKPTGTLTVEKQALQFIGSTGISTPTQQSLCSNDIHSHNQTALSKPITTQSFFNFMNNSHYSLRRMSTKSIPGYFQLVSSRKQPRDMRKIVLTTGANFNMQTWLTWIPRESQPSNPLVVQDSAFNLL